MKTEPPNPVVPERRCPKCNAPVAANTLRGLCPKCLALFAFDASEAGGTIVVASPDATGDPQRGPASAALPATLRYFGDYELQAEIARGGMGVVYRARQVSLNRIVAVKMILGGQLATPADVKRFHVEAESAANLQHPNIVAIHEVGEHEGRHYFSMDFVDGPNLATHLGEHTLAPTRAADLIKTLAEAVHYAHQRGVLHRDLKPQNILLDAEGRPRITDFGLAKRFHGDSSITITGTVMGSPNYMPPEQAAGRNDRVGPASDVYSLGTILYELLTGRPPFKAETPMQTLRQVLEDDPVAPSKLNPRIPRDLGTICLKCVEKEPQRRYSTARELAEELQRFLNGEPILARPPNPIRKAWLWLARHPWAITGLFSFVVLGLLGLAYGLAEESAMLRWKLANPQGKPLFASAGDFFSGAQAFGLGLAFLLQSLPLITFNQCKERGNLTRLDVWFFGPIGLVLVALGLWTANKGLKLEIWVNRFGPWVWLWGILSLSYVWFGSLLIWKIVQFWRERSAPLPGLPRQSPPPQFAHKGRFTWIVLLEMAAIVSATVVLFPAPAGSADPKSVTGEIVGWSIVLSIWSLFWTLLILISAHVVRSTGVDRTIYLPLLVPIVTVSFGGMIVLSMLEEAPGLPSLFTFVTGLAGGWAALRWGCLEVGQTPRLFAAIRRVKARQVVRAALALVAILALLLVAERVRGKWRLASVKAGMARRGQATEYKQLLTAPPSNFAEFTNRFATVSKVMGESMLQGSGNMVEVAPGKAARGSQAALPVDLQAANTLILTNDKARLVTNSTNTWAMLEQRLASKQVALAELRDLMRDPLPVWSADFLADLKTFKIPNFVRIRTAAQVLNDSLILNLHRGDLVAAEADLVALSGIVRVNVKDPGLVGQMIRVAIEGLSAYALWDAIQAGSWTEPQLEHLQRSWQMDPLVSGVAGALHAERLTRVEMYEVFRHSSYREWQSRAAEIITGFGATPRLPPYPVEVWRQYVFHPLWNFAWADHEEALWLERTDFMSNAPHEALRRRAFSNLGWEHDYERKSSYFATWRFYFALPLIEQMSDISGRPTRPERGSLAAHLAQSWFKPDFSVPNFARAFTTAARNENLRQMAVTAIALKRYRMRHGRFPDQLLALVPALLSEVPVDWIDGQPLRYRLNPDGAYTLYSIGQDGRDDGGDASPRDTKSGTSSFYDGRDLVWPALVPWEK